jgi:hypothetical protein
VRQLQREPLDISARMKANDWAGAAYVLGQKSNDEIRADIKKMNTRQRQLIISGARHSEPAPSEPANWVATIVTIMMEIDQRNALVGSLHWARWKHEWARAANWFTGLSKEDGRQVALELDFSLEDLFAVADSGSGNKDYLNVMFFAQMPSPYRREFVSAKDAGRQVLQWLYTHPIVAVYAKKKWSPFNLGPVVEVVPSGDWSNFIAPLHDRLPNPDADRPQTEAEARSNAVWIEGLTTETDKIYLQGGSNLPHVVVHEGIHATSPHADVLAKLGWHINEGMTEYFTRRVCVTAALHPGTEYPAWTYGVQALVDLVGEATVAAALFEAKDVALKAAVDGAAGSGSFVLWRAAMESLAMKEEDQAKLAAVKGVLKR